MKKQHLIIIDKNNRKIKMHQRPLVNESWKMEIGNILNIENKIWKVVDVCKNELEGRMTFNFLGTRRLFEKYKF